MQVNSEAMSIDELWALREEISKLLATKITEQKAELERRLTTLSRSNLRAKGSSPERRSYPKVNPKYRNPADSGETWTGRGKQPKWLRAQLDSGMRLTDFAIF